MLLNDRLKLLRNAKGITQKDAASALGIKQYNIADYESGRAIPNINILIKMSDLYEVTLDDLCEHKSNVYNAPTTSTVVMDEYIKDLHTLKIVRRIEKLTDEEKEIIYKTIDPIITNMFKK